jgi:hypothetical protein
MAERNDVEFEEWFTDHVSYLPGDTWPESWIVQRNQDAVAELAELVDEDKDALIDILEYGLQAGKHNEFYEIAGHLGLDEQQCLHFFTTNVKRCFDGDFKLLFDKIEKMLNENA